MKLIFLSIIQVDKMKKVLIINNGYPSKTEPNIYIFIHRQALALASAGYDVYVLDIDLRSIRWKRKFGVFEDRYQGIKVLRVSFPFITVKLPNVNNFLNKKIAVRQYKRLREKNGDYDIIHCHFGKNSGHAGWAIKQKYGIPLVITEHSSRIAQNLTEPPLNIYEQANKVLVVGTALQRCLALYGYTQSIVVPNVIDTNLFKVRGEKDKSKNFHFLSIGNLISRKRFDLVIKAFGELHKTFNNIQLTIVGEGPLKGELMDLVKDNNIRDVHILPPVPNDKINSIYCNSDCFVLASECETFGMVCAEAISCGVPVVVSDNGGASDIVDDSNGIIVPCDDEGALIRGMRQMIEKKEMYQPQQLHYSMEKKFSERKFLQTISDIYSELMEQSKHAYKSD